MFLEHKALPSAVSEGQVIVTGETNLNALLRNAQPELREGTYVFCSLPDSVPIPAETRPILTFREQEAMTVVIALEDAERLGLGYQFASRLITLHVHSSLDAVGFLAAVTARLAAADIDVNGVSAFYHDHLFVPVKSADSAS